MRIIALDFDGVIVNSANECLLVGHNAYKIFSDQCYKLKSKGHISDSRLKLLQSYRPFVLSGEDYVFISMAVELNHHFEHQRDFDKFKLKNNELTTQFCNLFNDERSNLLNTKKQLWLELNQFYEGMENFMRINESSDNLIIISTKQKIFITEILKNHNISIDERRIFHANIGTTKKEIIRKMLYENTIDPEDFFFIDDQVSTLIDVKELAIKCFLAKWGYNTKDKVRDAIKNDIPIITLSDFLNINGFIV